MELQTIANQLYELNLRAKKINYKNKIPKLPKNPTESTMSGFRKRLSNWTNLLSHCEAERMRGTISSDPNLLRNYLNN
jgi:hypothetical protein